MGEKEPGKRKSRKEKKKNREQTQKRQLEWESVEEAELHRRKKMSSQINHSVSSWTLLKTGRERGTEIGRDKERERDWMKTIQKEMKELATHNCKGRLSNILI